MSKFRDAWDRKTGEKLPYLVPAQHFTHPLYRGVIVDSPPRAGGAAASAAETKKESK